MRWSSSRKIPRIASPSLAGRLVHVGQHVELRTQETAGLVHLRHRHVERGELGEVAALDTLLALVELRLLLVEPLALRVEAVVADVEQPTGIEVTVEQVVQLARVARSAIEEVRHLRGLRTESVIE